MIQLFFVENHAPVVVNGKFVKSIQPFHWDKLYRYLSNVVCQTQITEKEHTFTL